MLIPANITPQPQHAIDSSQIEALRKIFIYGGDNFIDILLDQRIKYPFFLLETDKSVRNHHAAILPIGYS